MILQALKEYTDRTKMELGGFGYEIRKIPFIIVLSSNGEFRRLKDTRELEHGKLVAHEYEIPLPQVRSGKDSWKIAFVLWDHYGYVLGFSSEQNRKTATAACHASFIRLIDDISQRFPKNEDICAVANFLKRGEKGYFEQTIFSTQEWKECAKIKNCNLSFQIEGHMELICQTQDVRDYVADRISNCGGMKGRCLITGEMTSLERLHPNISLFGLKKPAPLCSINNLENPAFSSFGKSQGYNFPIGKQTAILYGKALNHLLKPKTGQSVGIGGTQVVFWASRNSPFENSFATFFSLPVNDDPGKGTITVNAFLKSVQTGIFSIDEESKTKFYVLGLSANIARIAIDVWIEDTIPGMAGKIAQHFKDIKIIAGREKSYLPLRDLLIRHAEKGKTDYFSQHIIGETLCATLKGLPYPQTLLQMAVNRVRVERGVSYPRAALIKACINRSVRFKNPSMEEELKVSLDTENKSAGYLLGRLFATLEKIQGEAQGNINSTIRDRFYGAASGTPVLVFGNLIRLTTHHLAKLADGRRIYFEKLMGEIHGGIDAKGYPAHLDLADQGRFAVGYYHQKQDFFTKKEDK